MLNEFFKTYIYPTAMMAGSIIGVGFLALPYIAVQVGMLTMILYFAAIVVFVVFIHVMLAEISLKTPDFKRFPGFVGMYLGGPAKVFTLILMIFGLISVLLVYILIGSQFLSAALQPLFGGTTLVYALMYFAAGAIVVYFGMRSISRFEFLALLALLMCFVLIFLKGFSNITLQNFFLAPAVTGWKTAFLPYGAILFSLWGTGQIPQIEEMMQGRKQYFKKVIVVGTLIPAGMYLIFMLLMVGITGNATTQGALSGLAPFLGGRIAFVALMIGAVATFAAFVSQSLLLKKILMYDMGLPKFPAFVVACVTPLLLFLLGIVSFIPLISFIGGFLLSIEGLFILMVYVKTGGRKSIAYPLMIFFALVVVYQIIYFL